MSPTTSPPQSRSHSPLLPRFHHARPRTVRCCACKVVSYLLLALLFLTLVILLLEKTSKMPRVPDSSTDELLPHLEYNVSGRSTILFAHGAFSSSAEYDLVVPFLYKDYHVIVPDLPSHGEAMRIRPFTLPYASRLLAKLIKQKAHNGSAHIVGLSLGAHVVADLAWRYPEVTLDVVASGYELYAPTLFTPFVPIAALTVQHLTSWLPRSLVEWVMEADMSVPMDKGVCTLSLSRQIVAIEVSNKWPKPSAGGVLIIAGTKSVGLVPGDRIKDALKLRDIERRQNLESIAVQHKGMRHPWNRQAPELFADMVRRWVEDMDLPAEFEKL